MKKILFFLLSCMICGSVAATNITVEQLSGADRQMALSTIGKVVVEDPMLYFYDKQGGLLFSVNTETIGTVRFTDIETKCAMPQMSDFKVYPNPANTVIMVDGVDDATPIRVYDLNGRMVTKSQCAQVDMTNVPAGNYLLQVESQIVKIIKK